MEPLHGISGFGAVRSQHALIQCMHQRFVSGNVFLGVTKNAGMDTNLGPHASGCGVLPCLGHRSAGFRLVLERTYLLME